MGLRDKAAEKYRQWEANQDAANAAQIARATTQREQHELAAPPSAPATDAVAPPAPVVDQRARARELLASTCPLPLANDPRGSLPGGGKLQPDEFLVSIGKDWGWSSQRLVLTTHRVISTHGRASKSAKSLYLVDVRDIRYHKPMIGTASITLEAASGVGSLEGLPAAKNGARLRDDLTALVHWARSRQQSPVVLAPPPAAAPSEDIVATIKRLADLRDAGALTPDEFEAKKRELLDRL
jgi:hypothetical protein